MKKLTFLFTIILLIQVFLPVNLITAQSDYEVRNVSTDQDVSENKTITGSDNDRIVWRSNGYDYYLYDGQTTTKIIENLPTNSQLFGGKMQGDYIGFVDYFNNTKAAQIFLYKISESTLTQISFDSALDKSMPLLQDDKVYWVSSNGGDQGPFNIYQFDIETGMTTILYSETVPYTTIKLLSANSQAISWVSDPQPHNSNVAIFKKDLTTDEITNPVIIGDQRYDNLSEDQGRYLYDSCVYENGHLIGPCNLYFYSNGVTEILDNAHFISSPQIKGSRIIWTAFTQNEEPKLKLLDLVTGQISVVATGASEPVLYKDRVAWFEYANSNTSFTVSKIKVHNFTTSNTTLLADDAYTSLEQLTVGETIVAWTGQRPYRSVYDGTGPENFYKRVYVAKPGSSTSPITPTNLTADDYFSNTQFGLQWNDNNNVKEVEKYNIYQNGVFVDAAFFTHSVRITPNTEGVYEYRVAAVNLSGIEGPKSDPITVVYDKTPPNYTYSTVPVSSNSYGWFNTDVTVTLSCSDNISGVDPCPSPVTYTSDGFHRLLPYDIVDRAGNYKSTCCTSFSLDKTLPTTDSVSLTGGVGNIFLSSSNATVTANVSDNLSGIIAAEYYIDIDPGSGNASAMSLNASSTQASVTRTFAGLSSGQHTIYVRTKDKAGNWSLANTASFTLLF